MPRSRDRLERGRTAARRGGLRRVLHALADASEPRQGLVPVAPLSRLHGKRTLTLRDLRDRRPAGVGSRSALASLECGPASSHQNFVGGALWRLTRLTAVG